MTVYPFRWLWPPTIQKIYKMKQIIFVGLMILSSLSYAQNNKVITTNLKVGGTCDMCKSRIERALDVKGVKFVEYTLDTHNLEITYISSKITEDKIHQLLNDAGHDTDKSKASDKAYDSIHHCCKYRVHVHEDGEHDSEEKGEDEHDHNDDDHEH